MKKTITEVETAIENRIAELEEEYELDIYDRNDIREEEYQKAGWRHSPYRPSQQTVRSFSGRTYVFSNGSAKNSAYASAHSAASANIP